MELQQTLLTLKRNLANKAENIGVRKRFARACRVVLYDNQIQN